MQFTKNKRSVWNIFKNSNGVFRLAIPFLVQFILSVMLIGFIHWRFTEEIIRFDSISSDTVSSIAWHQASENIFIISVLGISILGIFTFWFWMIYSHRIFGPIVQIRKKIKELLDENYNEKISLRRNDEFGAMADDLNQLIEKLKQRNT